MTESLHHMTMIKAWAAVESFVRGGAKKAHSMNKKVAKRLQ